MVYKLCYVENNKAWFTNDFKHQWGDDWGDKPYEHNAGEPYLSYYKNGIEYPLKHKVVYFEFPWWCDYELPNYGTINSPYSVQDINNYRCPWLILKSNANGTEYIFAGTTYTKFIKKLKSLGCTIYTPLKGGNYEN